MALSVENLSAGYGGAPVLHDISLTVGDNEAVAIVGANGAGKSTLVRAIAGLSAPMGGAIRMDGLDITAVPPHRRQEHGIAVVLEERNLFAELTVEDNLRLSERAGLKAKRSKDGKPIRIADVLDLFPLVAERLRSRVELLSGGQQQMVAVARALLLQPSLLVLDELTTGLAPKVVQDILATLLQLRERGLGVLVVEQSVALAAKMTDRAYVLSVGRVVQEVHRDDWPRLLQDQSLTKAYLHG